MRNFPEYKRADELDPELQTRLDNYRDLLGQPVVITAGFEDQGHVPGSEHGQLDKNGKPCSQAADHSCRHATLRQQYDAAVKAGFVNIGIYPKWSIPGLHTGIRKHADTPGGRRWIGLGSGNKQAYLAWTDKNVKKYLI